MVRSSDARSQLTGKLEFSPSVVLMNVQLPEWMLTRRSVWLAVHITSDDRLQWARGWSRAVLAQLVLRYPQAGSDV